MGYKGRSQTDRHRRPRASETAAPGRTLYHLGFAREVTQAAPPGIEVRVEYPLSLQSRRVDLLLLRRRGVRRRDHEASILCQLWPHLGDHTLLDFKGPTRGFRRGELIRLESYGAEYLATRSEAFDQPSLLCLVLVVPKMTPTLAREIAWLGLHSQAVADGYTLLTGSRYTVIVVLLDRVAEREKDLQAFTDRPTLDKDVAHRILTWLTELATMEDIEQLEDVDDLLDKLIAALGPEMILRHLKPEQRLAGLEPAERLAGLEPAERLAGLEPAELMRALRALPRDLQQTIRSGLKGS